MQLPPESRLPEMSGGAAMRRYTKLLAAGIVLPALIGVTGSAFSGDLDEDGISKYTEDPITKYSELGKPEPNVSFIILNAKSKAKVLSQKGEQAGKGGGIQQPGSANLNSVILGAGGTVQGDIIIIDEGRGDKTVIAD